MNIINALRTLAEHEINVNLSHKYNYTANISVNTNGNKYIPDSKFVKMPYPMVTANGSINLFYDTNGIVELIESGDKVPCVHSQSVSIINNGKKNHMEIVVAESDIDKVVELGMVMNGNILDLNQFEIATENVNLEKLFADACESYAAKIITNKREPKKEKTARELFLESQGIVNGHWCPKFEKYEKKNTVQKTVNIVIDGCESKPSIDSYEKKVAKNKPLKFNETILQAVLNNTCKFNDKTYDVNLAKFNLIYNDIEPFTKSFTTVINGFTFNGTIEVK